MAHGPYWADLDADATGKRWVKPAKWDQLVNNIINWQADRQANGKGLLGLGVLSFGAGGYINGASKVGVNCFPANHVDVACVAYSGAQSGGVLLTTIGATRWWTAGMRLKADNFGVARLAVGWDPCEQIASPVEALSLWAEGQVVIGGTLAAGLSPSISGTGKLYHVGNTARIVGTTRTPVSAADAGNVGELCFDGAFLYLCVGANTWRRIAHASW